MKPEFILVTGANGAGKTMLIEANRPLLEQAGFRIIIPDFILRHAASLTDTDAIMKEHFDEAITKKTYFVLESPFQFDSLTDLLARTRTAGYNMSMYQLFVKDESQSAIRVKDRFNAGGMYINTEQVISNFRANKDNVGKYYGYFDHSYFIDNSTNQPRKLVAQFRRKKLVLFRSQDHSYLRDLFIQSAVKGKTYLDALSIIKGNQDYTSNGINQKQTHRLKL
jgi:predicted ABC-type ATPase